MKILVYGAGNIGSLYAARLSESGEQVSILAPGERLSPIREHGIELENVTRGEKTTVAVTAPDPGELPKVTNGGPFTCLEAMDLRAPSPGV